MPTSQRAKARRGKGEGSIHLRGDGRWAATVTLEPKGGKRQRRTFYGKTAGEVAKKLREAQKKLDDNLPLPSEQETVNSYLHTWLQEFAKPDLRPRTFTSYQLIVDKHLTPELGKLKLARLSPEHIQRYMNGKRASGLSPRTVQYHHAVLRAALADAERLGKVARNVARLVAPPRLSQLEVRPLTPPEARTLLNGISGTRFAPLYALAIGIGLRQGELLGLRWDDLDLDARTVTVRHTLQRYDRQYHLDEPKTLRSRRTLAIPVALVQMLRTHRIRQLQERVHAGPAWKGDDWHLVFCTESGGPLSGNNLTHQFQALLVALDLPRQKFHDLRHAAATFMLAQGVDLRVVMEVLGHSQIHVTANTYAHVKIEATRVAVEAVDALLAR